MKILSRKKCKRGHRMLYYNEYGIGQWCLWCPKCKTTGHYDKNYYTWPRLNKVAKFVWEVKRIPSRIIKVRWWFASKLVGDNAVGRLTNDSRCCFCRGHIVWKD